ncbi:MAG: hypothetical protein R3B99_34180 [Polyangiales bacterium]
MLEVEPVDEVHHDVVHALVDPERVHLHHVAMLQSRAELRFFEEQLLQLRVAAMLREQDLDGDAFLEPARAERAPLEDLRHAPVPEAPEQAVGAERAGRAHGLQSPTLLR